MQKTCCQRTTQTVLQFMHPDGKMCPTVLFNAAIDGKKTQMLAAVAPRSLLPYPAIVGRNGSGLNIQWEVNVSTRAEKSPDINLEQQESGEAGEPSSQVLDESAYDPEPATEDTCPAEETATAATGRC